MNKELDLKDGADLINVQNRNYVSRNINQYLVIHFSTWWCDEVLIRLASVDDLAIKLIAKVVPVWLAVTPILSQSVIHLNIYTVPVQNTNTETIVTGELVL